MKAKEYLEDLLKEGCPGYNILDSKVHAALCEYAVRIGNEGYSMVDLSDLLHEYLNDEDVEECKLIVEHVDFAAHNNVVLPDFED